MGIAGMPEIPIVSHFRYKCRYCIRKICIPYMLLAQNLQEIPTNFTEISTKIIFLHDFPTFNVGYPHSIPVKSKSLQFLHGNQSVEISKLQGLWVIPTGYTHAIPIIFMCILQGTFFDTGIPHFYGENICSVVCDRKM